MNLILAMAAVVAFENVNVIPMDRERVLERQTVVVRDGRIEKVGRGGAPNGAVRVDAKGKYLMPGFAEMHGHLPAPNTPRATVEAVLFLFVANGVTTVRGMLGGPGHLELRSEVASGRVLGPTLYVAGPAFGGQALTPEEAARRVGEQKAAGFDLLKVQEGLRPESYEAMAKAARQAGVPFAGHVPNDVGLLRALEAGQASIDHLDGYYEALAGDESRIPSLVAATRKAGAAVVPTMALWETFHSESAPQLDELQYVPPQWREQWAKQKAAMLAKRDAAESGRIIATRRKILKALSDGGVRIVFGTDAPQIYSVPGFSIHREIPIMTASGMTPYQVLASGTRHVAEYFGSKEFGTVEAGRRADLMLLDANPLADLGNLQRRAGVMVRGRWLPESEIQQKLREIAAIHR